MSCPDTSTLWSLEAGELQGDAHAATLAHALSCLACQSMRKELRGTLALLGVGAQPAINWSRVDAAVDDAIAKAALKQARPFSFLGFAVPALAFGAVAVALLFFVHAPTPKIIDAPSEIPIVSTHAEVAEVAPTVMAPLTIEVSSPKKRSAQQKLRTGDRQLSFALANGGRAELGANSSLSLEGSTLSLQSGTLIASAENELRVRGTGVSVKGAKTALYVSQTPGFFEVAVADGAALMERDGSGSQWIQAGESVRFERGNLLKNPLSEDQRKAFAAFGVEVKKAAGQLATSAEELFLSRAERSLKAGSCGEFLLGLDTLAFDAEEETVRGRARILKARCHDERLEPEKAGIEYRRYLRDFPSGAFAAEARRAVQE